MNIPVSVDMQGLAIVCLIHVKNGLDLIQVQAVIFNTTTTHQAPNANAKGAIFIPKIKEVNAK